MTDKLSRSWNRLGFFHLQNSSVTRPRALSATRSCEVESLQEKLRRQQTFSEPPRQPSRLQLRRPEGAKTSFQLKYSDRALQSRRNHGGQSSSQTRRRHGSSLWIANRGRRTRAADLSGARRKFRLDDRGQHQWCLRAHRLCAAGPGVDPHRGPIRRNRGLRGAPQCAWNRGRVGRIPAAADSRPRQRQSEERSCR
jgi:hypothetical protein